MSESKRYKTVRDLVSDLSPETLPMFDERAALDSRVALLLAHLTLEQTKALEVFLRVLFDLPGSAQSPEESE